MFSYNKLLEVFFSVIDPIDDGGQFQDRGSQYRTIFYTNEDQKDLRAIRSPTRANNSFRKAIATKILPASTFTKQKNIIKILQKNPERYAQEQQDRANYKSN